MWLKFVTYCVEHPVYHIIIILDMKRLIDDSYIAVLYLSISKVQMKSQNSSTSSIDTKHETKSIIQRKVREERRELSWQHQHRISRTDILPSRDNCKCDYLGPLRDFDSIEVSCCMQYSGDSPLIYDARATWK